MRKRIIDATNTQSVVSTDLEKRQCEGTSKKTGERCTAWAVTGKTLCAGHGAPKEQLLKARNKSAEVRKRIVEERPRSLKDAVARKLEQRADEIAALIDHDIERKDSASVRYWMEQAYGKPQQTVQTEDVTKPLEEKGYQELVEMLRQQVKQQN